MKRFLLISLCLPNVLWAMGTGGARKFSLPFILNPAQGVSAPTLGSDQVAPVQPVAPAGSRQLKYGCRMCVAVFSGAILLRRHQKAIHHCADTHCLCGYCGHKVSVADAKKHQREVHFHERPFACQFCGRSFTRNLTRTRHEDGCSLRHAPPFSVWHEERFPR